MPLPPEPVPVLKKTNDKPLTLSDIIPPPAHVRTISDGSILIDDDSLLRFTFARASDIPQTRIRVSSDASPSASAKRRAIYRHSRHSSVTSFSGFGSFDEVQRGFEASDNRPFYPPPGASTSQSRRDRKHESMLSLASVSSYGRTFNYGLPDPFEYGLPSLQERPLSEDMTGVSILSSTVDDTFSFIHRQPRRRVESDASRFYYRPSRASYSMSVGSQMPPVSLYNRGSNDGVGSKQASCVSIDSVMSDFSMMRLGRPGLGDKMFEDQQGTPLSAIAASPTLSVASPFSGADSPSRYEFDSVMDDGPSEPKSAGVEDSIFDRTGYNKMNSVTTEEVFGAQEEVEVPRAQPEPQYRPLSILDFGRLRRPAKEDDMMISVSNFKLFWKPRCSFLSFSPFGRCLEEAVFVASPCKLLLKHRPASGSRSANIQIFKELSEVFVFRISRNSEQGQNYREAVHCLSFAATMSDFSWEESMIKARQGLLARESLEESCIIGEGEEVSSSCAYLSLSSCLFWVFIVFHS